MEAKIFLCHIKRLLIVLLTFGVAVSYFFSLSSYAQSFDITLAWDANRENDLAGYRIYYSEEGRDFDYGNPAWEGATPACMIYNLDATLNYCFTARAFNILEEESGDSNIVCYNAPVEGIANTALSAEDQPTFTREDTSVQITLDAEDPDGDEVVAGNEPTNRSLIPGVAVIETGELTLTHDWRSISLAKTFTDPIVIAKSFSNNNTDPGVVRIRNVHSKGFEIRIQEWDYLDGRHPEESAGYLVMNRGLHHLPDGTAIISDRLETDRTGTFLLEDFGYTFQKTPVVLAAVTSYNDREAVTTRLRNTSTTAFQVLLQEQELNAPGHKRETISYIAWEPSSGVMGDFVFTVSSTGDVVTQNWHTIAFGDGLDGAPVFLSDIQTYDGGDTATIRWQNKDAYGVDIKITEERSRDSEIFHTTEAVGYILCTPIPNPVHQTTIENAGFESGKAPWMFYTNGSGSLNVTGPGNESANAAVITTNSAGTNVQLFQYNIALQPNTQYQLSFAGYSNTGHDLSVSVLKHGAPYTNYGLSFGSVNLTTGWRTYSLIFTTANFSSPVDDARLMFWFADTATAGDRFHIDDVMLSAN